NFGTITDAHGGINNFDVAAATIFVLGNANVNTANAAQGNIALTADTSMNLGAGATLQADDGSITLTANEAVAPSSGNFTGIEVRGATIKTTGAGNILLHGRGGNDAASSGHHGLLVDASAFIRATGTGTVTLVGKGGSGIDANEGVNIQDF